MKGNTLNEFIDDLYHNPEKEIAYRGKKYMIRGYFSPDANIYSLEVCTIETLSRILFKHSSYRRGECVELLTKAKIFDGKTIYEAEQDIEVLYG